MCELECVRISDWLIYVLHCNRNQTATKMKHNLASKKQTNCQEKRYCRTDKKFIKLIIEMGQYQYCLLVTTTS